MERIEGAIALLCCHVSIKLRMLNHSILLGKSTIDMLKVIRYGRTHNQTYATITQQEDTSLMKTRIEKNA